MDERIDDWLDLFGYVLTRVAKTMYLFRDTIHNYIVRTKGDGNGSRHPFRLLVIVLEGNARKGLDCFQPTSHATASIRIGNFEPVRSGPSPALNGKRGGGGRTSDDFKLGSSWKERKNLC